MVWLNRLRKLNTVFTFLPPFQMKQSNSFIWIGFKSSSSHWTLKIKDTKWTYNHAREKSFSFNPHAHVKFCFLFSLFSAVSSSFIFSSKKTMTELWLTRVQSDHRGLADYFLLEETVLVLLLAELLWELKGTQLEADVLNFRVEDNSNIWCWSEAEMGTTFKRKKNRRCLFCLRKLSCEHAGPAGTALSLRLWANVHWMLCWYELLIKGRVHIQTWNSFFSLSGHVDSFCS